jgi:predicted RNase H-like HicB family nuclease
VNTLPTTWIRRFFVNLSKMLVMKYLVIYEQGRDGFSAYVPDLPGCTTAGATLKEVKLNIKEAISLHLEVMKEEGLEIPVPVSNAEIVEL